MSKEKFLKARSLMDASRFKQAAAILKTLDHPTARKWLQDIEEQAPGATGGAASAKPKVRGGGGGVVLIGLIAVTVLLWIIGIGAISVGLGEADARNLAAMGPTATQGPSPTVGPTPSPTITPTPIPCEQQQWWNTNSGALTGFFGDDLTLLSVNSVEALTTRIEEARAARDAFAAVEHPPCLETLYQATLSAMDARIVALTAPAAQRFALGEFTQISADEYRDFYNKIADAVAALNSVIVEATAQQITFDASVFNEAGLADANTLLVDPALNVEGCDAQRWVLTEVLVFRIMVRKTDEILDVVPRDLNQLQQIRVELANEFSRIGNQTDPTCMDVPRAQIRAGYDAMIALVQALGNEDNARASQSQTELDNAEAALQTALRDLSFTLVTPTPIQ